MEKLKIQEIISFTKGIKIQETKNQDITKISIDSREVDQDTLFIPIIGEKFDGHTFMESAYNLGCRNFLCDENHEFNKENINLIKVKDTKIALGHIAKGYKEKFNLTTIGITGSVGKTSTKDIISSVLSQKYNTLKTQGNQNNEIGLPKTLLNINKKTQIAVIEMAMDKKGDLNYLTNIVHPNIAIITNIGMSHIMNFKNQEGIFYSKMEIANSLTSKDTLIVNGDDKYLKTLKNKQHDYKLLTYGFEESNDIYCKDYKIEDNYVRSNDEHVAIESDSYDVAPDTVVKSENVSDNEELKHFGLESAFDIKLIQLIGGIYKKNIDGTVTVYLPTIRKNIGEKVKIYYIKDDYTIGETLIGEVVKYNNKYMIKFETNHFSIYGIEKMNSKINSEEIENPQTGDNIYNSFIILVTSILSISLIIISQIKKQKNKY